MGDGLLTKVRHALTDRQLARFAAVALGVLSLSPAAAAVAAASRATVVTTCGERVEGLQPVRPPDRRDLVIGPVAFRGLRVLGRVKPGSYTIVGGRRYGVWKAAPVVQAGKIVNVVVPRRLRGRLLLEVARHKASSAVRFQPCSSDQPAFSYRGTVGRYTAWAGGFLAVGPICAEVEVWVDGRPRALRRAFPLGTVGCS